MAKILLVEDDFDLALAMEDWLKEEHYFVEVVNAGDEAILRLKICNYDAVVLDWNLPNKSGLAVVQDIRGRGDDTPVLMLTSRAEVQDKTKGLDSGADDYLTKPFQPAELSARLRALIRRSSKKTSNTLQLGAFFVDPNQFLVQKRGKEIKLQPLEFALLEFFIRHPNEVFSQDALLSRVWPTDSQATTETVRVYVGTLRNKIDDKDGASFIETIHRKGYKFLSHD